MSERAYPISPRPEHGYPEITGGRDFLELQQALFGFLYVGPDAAVSGS